MSFTDRQDRNRAQANDHARKRFNPAEEVMKALDEIEREKYRRAEGEEDDAVRDAREGRAVAGEARDVTRFDRTEKEAAQAAMDATATKGIANDAKKAEADRKARADKEGRAIAEGHAAMAPHDRAGPGATMREGGLRPSEIADKANAAGMDPDSFLAGIDQIEESANAARTKTAAPGLALEQKAKAAKDANALGWAGKAETNRHNLVTEAAKANAPKDSSKLRKEFNALPMVKAFKEVEVSFDKMKQAAAHPSAAGDLSLIFSFMKMLDPGSTVREGEFANAQNAGGIDDSVLNAYNKILNGQRLNEGQRKDFLGSAQQFYGSQRKAFEQEAKRYGGLASRGGMDAGDVIGDPLAPEDETDAEANDLGLDPE